MDGDQPAPFVRLETTGWWRRMGAGVGSGLAGRGDDGCRNRMQGRALHIQPEDRSHAGSPPLLIQEGGF